jgi:polyhydroxybutyrate depolymerase
MAGELVDGEIRAGGLTRTFVIQPPRDVPAGQVVPLVLVLHGNHPGAGGRLMVDWTTFGRQADRWGLAVAYPDGVGGCWADGRGVTTADEAGVDDVAFLTALIDWSARRYGSAPDRTLVAGMSNGAFMAHRVGLDAAERVAAVAAVAGGMPAALLDREPSHAVSAMLIHGDADAFSPIEGGYSRRRGPDGELRGRTLSLAESAERWRTIDRCPPGAVRTDSGEFSRRTTSAGGAGGTRVAAWTVFGGGHTWPGAPVPPGSTELSTTEFDAAEEICRFAHPLLLPAEDRALSGAPG